MMRFSSSFMPCQTVKQTGDIMKYPIVIELGDEKTACDVRIPDLDVFTAADTFEDCYAVAVEAAKIELDNMARNDRKIPTPSKVEDIVKIRNTKASTWGWWISTSLHILEKQKG